MAIVKPENMDFRDKNIIMIITGQPGVGKTTLALSAPDVLLIDADEGMARVKGEHRKVSSMCKTYEELLGDIKQAEGAFKTLVIDTGGALIDLLKDWAIRTDNKASKASGGISLQGFGVVKTEFLRLFAELRKKFNVILLFHESKEKQNDEICYEIICEGSAKTLVWQPADLGAHLHIVNGKRFLGFTPTMNYSAKSAYGIKGLIEVPELKDGDNNDFLARLIARVKANLTADFEEHKTKQEAYEKAIAEGYEIIQGIDAPEKVIPAFNAIKALTHSLTSLKELESGAKAKVRDLGYIYSAEAKTYVTKTE